MMLPVTKPPNCPVGPVGPIGPAPPEPPPPLPPFVGMLIPDKVLLELSYDFTFEKIRITLPDVSVMISNS